MTILRQEEHRALASMDLSGKVADLGGDLRSAYQKLVPGTRMMTIVNLDPKTHPDVVADLELPLPMADGSFDGVLMMNVLEHVFHAHQLLKESHRILSSNGTLILSVPYLFPYHASPKDYFRFSKDALELMLAEAGYTVTKLIPLGSGVLAARYVLIERLLPGRIQKGVGVITHPMIALADRAVTWLARSLRKQYKTQDYALGYVVQAMRV